MSDLFPDAAVAHLRAHGVRFEPGLSDAEVARIEGEFRFRFPPDLRRFLRAALPVTGGFPNWRSESAAGLRRLLERPSRGVRFDVEHNDFWAGEWGPCPGELDEALAEAARRLAEAPPLVPIRSHHYLPSMPHAEGNPVLAVRQSDIACVGRDLSSYLMSLFGPDEARIGSMPGRAVPFWTDVARSGCVRVPNLAGPAVAGAEPEYERLCRVAREAGYWAKVVPLRDGPGVTLDRAEPAGDRKSGPFWVMRRDFGWLLCVRGPRPYIAPDADRVPELCLALLDELSHDELRGGQSSLGVFRLNGSLRREFGLTAIPYFTQMDDEWERKARAWERHGWREMSYGQMDEAWDAYGEHFGGPVCGPFRTPTPSATWDIAPVYLRGQAFQEQVEADLTAKALAALRACTRPGEELLALDLNHPCYFFEPHAGSDAAPDPWPVPVLPDGDHYIFLARDFRFGIVGNCVDMTMCVFGPELLAEFDASRPLAFARPTWTAEERHANERRRADLDWRRLGVDENEDVWERFDTRFGFDPSRSAPSVPAIAEPTPSVTWAVPPATGADPAVADRVAEALLRGLQRATRPGERLSAHAPPRWYEHYTFDPHRLSIPDRDFVLLGVNPDDGFTILLAPDFRFGVVVDPVERTVCAFGGELLDALDADAAGAFGTVVRRDGVAVAE